MLLGFDTMLNQKAKRKAIGSYCAMTGAFQTWVCTPTFGLG